MVDIVIVNWNSGLFLSKCVNSLLTPDNERCIHRIFIIDNHSTDDSLSKVPSHTKILTIRNESNLGFSKSCNIGFRATLSPYVLLLNPDTIVPEGTLGNCLEYMTHNYDVDILGCQLLDDSGEVTASCARFPSPLYIFYDASGLSKMVPKIFKPSTLMTDWHHLSSRKVPQVIGAFMWMRKNIFDRIGYFDEQFFVYFEELDFSKRLSDAGGVSFYNANIRAIHSGGGTTQNVKAFRLYLFLQSRLKYAKKYFSSWGIFSVVLSTYLVEPFTRCFFGLLTGNFSTIKEVASAYRMLIAKKDA